MRSDDWNYRAFTIKHNYDVKSLLLAYSLILIQAITLIWDKIEWKEKKVKNSYKIPFKNEKEKGEIIRTLEREKKIVSKERVRAWRKIVFSTGEKWVKVYYEAKRLMPKIPSSKRFKKALRDQLVEEWRRKTNFAAHYVDSAIKQAYSILKTWRKNYKKGRARKRKPLIRRRFIRIKETLFSYNNGIIRITVVPYEKYLDFKIPEWIMSRIIEFLGRKPENGDFGELILKEDELMIVVRKAKKKGFGRKIAIDTNLNTIDGFDPANGFFTEDISKMRRIAEAYDEQISKLQSYERRKPSLRGKRRKLLKRRNCRIVNEAHIKAKKLANEYKGCLFVFEELNKRGMFKDSFDKKKATELVKKIKSIEIDWMRAREIVDEISEEEPERSKVEELSGILTKIYSPSFKKLMKKYNKEAYEKYKEIWKLSFELKRCWNYHSRRLHQTVWRRLHKTVEYKAKSEYVPSYKTTKSCSRCGDDVVLRNGQVICNCEKLGAGEPFVLNRHYSACLNIYFLSWGFPPGPLAFYRFLIRDGTCRRLTGSGVALCGGEPDAMPPMNPEGDKGGPKGLGDVHQEARSWANAHNG